MKAAVCFWGLCRSTDKIIESLQRNIFDILRNAGIQYDVFVHTFPLVSILEGSSVIFCYK